MIVSLLIVASVLASGLGQLLLRRGAMAVPPLSLQSAGDLQSWLGLVNGCTLAGLALWVLSTVLWLVVLNRTELSYAYVLGSLNYVIIPLVSQHVFAEPIGRLRLIGIAVIFLGVLLSLYGRATEQAAGGIGL